MIPYVCNLIVPAYSVFVTVCLIYNGSYICSLKEVIRDGV